MLRLIAITLLLLSASALAQTAQFPGVAPSVPSPQLGGAPAPPVMMPGPTISPGYASPSTLVTRPNGPPVEVPGGSSNFSNKVERCIQAGAAAGVGPNDIGSFTSRCAN